MWNHWAWLIHALVILAGQLGKHFADDVETMTLHIDLQVSIQTHCKAIQIVPLMQQSSRECPDSKGDMRIGLWWPWAFWDILVPMGWFWPSGTTFSYANSFFKCSPVLWGSYSCDSISSLWEHSCKWPVDDSNSILDLLMWNWIATKESRGVGRDS